MTRKFENKEEVNYFAVADEDYKGVYPCPSVKKGDVVKTDKEHVDETLEKEILRYNLINYVF